MKQWKFISGYVKIGIKGQRIEKALNTLIANGVSVHDVTLLGHRAASVFIRSDNLHEATALINECGCESIIISKKGITAIKQLFLSRLPLFLTVLICFTAMLVISQRILFIRIDGLDNIEEEQVRDVLNSVGVHEFIHRKNIDFNLVRTKLLEMDKSICYADIRPNGVIATVVIRESDTVIERDDSTPASIYADKDCTILSVTAENGNIMVKKGQTVKRNTLLISGDITPQGSDTRLLVRAKGEIVAQVVYRFSCIVDSICEVPVRTGNFQPITQSETTFLRFADEIEYSDYEIEINDKKVLTACGIPIDVISGTAYELTLTRGQISQAEMEHRASIILDEKLKNALPHDAQIIAKQTEFTVLDDGSLLAVINVTTIENVGYAKSI